jgi:hypothetical protein
LVDTISSAPEDSRDPRDAWSWLVILASLAAGLAASWERWGIPLIDSGREMNVPLRLLRGEMLYSDVRYIYGPLSPYVNATLYWILHPSLWVLWGRGIATTIIILAMVYWIARQVTGRLASTLACLAITWICAIKPQGNYILPYAYSGLDGCVFGLATLASLLQFVRRKNLPWLLPAGAAAALASLSKAEMGVAAIGTGVAAAALAGYPRWDRMAGWSAIFLAPALGLQAAVLEWFALRVGWHTLTYDSYLFFAHTPWQLIHFNKVRFGLDHPWHSLWLMIASLIRLMGFAGLLASASLFLANRRVAASSERITQSVALLGGSLAVIALTSLGLADLGPLLAMPLIVLALLVAGLAGFVRGARGSPRLVREQPAVFVLLCVFAFASLGRIIFRVSTGGALSSFLLPVPIVLFIYLWLALFPLLFASPAARDRSRQVVAAVLILSIAVTAVTVSVRYQRKFTYPLRTARGTWITVPDQGAGFDQALRFIETNTAPEDAVAVLPEGSSLNYLSGRRNPLRDEIFLPGLLSEADEERAIDRLRTQRVPLILVANRSTQEFGQSAFGVDYYQRLMSWIDQNYKLCGVFGPRPDPSLVIGDPTFFIRGYCRTAVVPS